MTDRRAYTVSECNSIPAVRAEQKTESLLKAENHLDRALSHSLPGTSLFAVFDHGPRSEHTKKLIKCKLII